MRVLTIRDPDEPAGYDFVLQWLRKQPDMTVDSVSVLDPFATMSSYDVVVPWLQDPCDSRPVWARALAIEASCARRGIPMINRPSLLPHARKSRTAAILRRHVPNVRVPFIVSFAEAQRSSVPAFLREDGLHAVDLFRIDTREQLLSEDVRARAAAMAEPVIVELIETAVAGVYTKFRYVVAGDTGIPLHVQCSTDWVTRGSGRLFTPTAIKLEQTFVALSAGCCPDLHIAAKALGFDFCAFDFSYDNNSTPVVWEVNPLPLLHHVNRMKGDLDLEYRNTATTRALEALATLIRSRCRR